MIIVKEYRGHIRNWEALCKELNIDASLKREAREEEILIRAYQTWGCEMADHMHGMFAFALWDEEEKNYSVFVISLEQNHSTIMRQQTDNFCMVQ